MGCNGDANSRNIRESPPFSTSASQVDGRSAGGKRGSPHLKGENEWRSQKKLGTSEEEEVNRPP